MILIDRHLSKLLDVLLLYETIEMYLKNRQKGSDHED